MIENNYSARCFVYVSFTASRKSYSEKYAPVDTWSEMTPKAMERRHGTALVLRDHGEAAHSVRPSECRAQAGRTYYTACPAVCDEVTQSRKRTAMRGMECLLPAGTLPACQGFKARSLVAVVVPPGTCAVDKYHDRKAGKHVKNNATV